MVDNPESEVSLAEDLCDKLASDLQAVMTGNALEKPVAESKSQSYDGPSFGSVYFGPLNWFAKGVPHFGMVTGGLLGREIRPEVPFSPITTKKSHGSRAKKAVLLPPGTLPAKSSNSMVLKASWILLHFTIPISLRRWRGLIQTGQMHFVVRLPDQILDEARSILTKQ